MGSLHMNANLLIMWCLFFVVFQFVYSHDINVVAHNSWSASCIDTERRALIEFKGSLVDDAHRLSSWTGNDCCNWDGITCNNLTGHVQKVDLRNPVQYYYVEYFFSDNFDDHENYCLRGEVNSSICDLEHLIHLDLSSNDFSGTQIPQCLGSLRNLRYLNLSAAGFQGEIPPHLGNLSQLQHLGLGQGSSFGKIANSLRVKSLEWVTGFSFLKSLDLSGNDLSGCVDWLESINMLPTLSSLNLRQCQLPGDKLVSALLPSHFNLTSLVSLDIGSNDLKSSSLLNWFSNLTSNLQVLRLDFNFFEGPFPFMLQKFKSLIVLHISFNNFVKSSWLLDSLCELISLTYVDLSDNQLEGSLPICLGRLISLKTFYIGGNKFGGKIPSELCYLNQLTDLDFSGNSFISSIPSCIGQLSKLEVLGVSGKGEISEIHFMKLQTLKALFIDGKSLKLLTLNVSPQWIPPFQLAHLDMYSLRIGSQFPTWLQTQKSVAVLQMANVGISDPIPEWVGTTFCKVQFLDLSSNNIHGVVPLSIKNLKFLKFLFLSNNQLNETIPEWIGEELSQLQHLQLHSNNFYGVIPSSLKKLKSLCDLDLSNNRFTGTIPEWIGEELSQLQNLELQSNNFYGVILSSLKKLKSLYYLDLSNNRFTGTIPEWIDEELSQLQYLQLQSNNFYGVIPSSLKKLKSLLHLDLSNNRFNGSIPEWIGEELSELQQLKLQSNNFSGNIPIQLCQLGELNTLKLAKNSLSGRIPDCFINDLKS